MSWTADRERAVWSQHLGGDNLSKLWTVTVGRDRLLAHYHEMHRGKDEYVIDPTACDRMKCGELLLRHPKTPVMHRR